MGTLRLRELVLPQQPIQSIPHDMCIGIYMYTHPMVHVYRHPHVIVVVVVLAIQSKINFVA